MGLDGQMGTKNNNQNCADFVNVGAEPRTRPTNTCKISAVGRLGTHQKEQIGGPNYSAKINIPEFHKYKTGFEKKKFTKIPKTGLIFTKKNGLIFMKFGYVI